MGAAVVAELASTTLVETQARTPLSAVVNEAPEGCEPVPGFPAWLHGTRYEVTAVLERTAVLSQPEDRWAEKRTARLEALEVEAGAVSWRRRPPRRGAFHHPPR